jgi:hypothetical protein
MNHPPAIRTPANRTRNPTNQENRLESLECCIFSLKYPVSVNNTPHNLLLYRREEKSPSYFYVDCDCVWIWMVSAEHAPDLIIKHQNSINKNTKFSLFLYIIPNRILSFSCSTFFNNPIKLSNAS